jgi:hypothetical protein
MSDGAHGAVGVDQDTGRHEPRMRVGIPGRGR